MSLRDHAALWSGTDALGSLTMALDGKGKVLATQLYDPYGNVRYSNGSIPGSYGFAGQHSDSTTGVDCNVCGYATPPIVAVQ